jgi:hypothetical protein
MPPGDREEGPAAGRPRAGRTPRSANRVVHDGCGRRTSRPQLWGRSAPATPRPAQCHRQGTCTAPRQAPRGRPGDAADRPVAERGGVHPARGHLMNDAINSSRDRSARGPWMTPALARQLAAAAGDLCHQLREGDLARDADPDPARRRAGWRLDVAAGGLRSAAEELLDTADELTRLADRRTDACPVPSGTCPEHGATLRSTGGRCWCSAPGCLRRCSTTDSPNRAPNRSPTASSTPTATSSISATVTRSTPAPASSAPRSSRCPDRNCPTRARYRTSIRTTASRRGPGLPLPSREVVAVQGGVPPDGLPGRGEPSCRGQVAARCGWTHGATAREGDRDRRAGRRAAGRRRCARRGRARGACRGR